ncbi:MAG: hypothetical protein RRY08_01510, partial [Christensenella sp.]
MYKQMVAPMQGIPKKSSRQAMTDWLNATATLNFLAPPTNPRLCRGGYYPPAQACSSLPHVATPAITFVYFFNVLFVPPKS